MQEQGLSSTKETFRGLQALGEQVSHDMVRQRTGTLKRRSHYDAC